MATAGTWEDFTIAFMIFNLWAAVILYAFFYRHIAPLEQSASLHFLN